MNRCVFILSLCVVVVIEILNLVIIGLMVVLLMCVFFLGVKVRWFILSSCKWWL